MLLRFRRHRVEALDSPTPTDDEIRLKVLDLADDGATALFMLPGAGFEGDGHRESPLAETQRITRELLEDGYIVILAVRGGAPEEVDAADGVAAINADANWQRPGKNGVETLYEVALTRAGDAAYWKLRAALNR